MKARKEEPELERRFFCVGELQSMWEVQGKGPFSHLVP